MGSVESSARQQILCSRCQKLDITNVLLGDDEELPETGKSVLFLGKQSARINCDMCRFFFSLSPNYKKKYKLHIRLFDRIKQKRNLPAFKRLVRNRFLSVLRDNSRLEYDYIIQNEATQNGILVYLPVEQPTPSAVQLVDATMIDYRLLDSWLSDCQGLHNLCNRVEDQRSSLPYLYLIDCIQERVVRANPSEKYLALSYVWGEQSSEHNPKAMVQETWLEGSFSFTQAPLTVQDAIRVVRNLERKYLWVDKYCINQDEISEKSMMIRNMDQIYENAEATIVAIYGKNDKAGLPGVSKTLRKPQPCLQTAYGHFVSSFPPISTVIANSKWATRGWTYQEARLSRRCLFFTDH